LAYQNAFSLGLSYGSQASQLSPLFTVNTIIFMALGFVIGYLVASTSSKNPFAATFHLKPYKF